MRFSLLLLSLLFTIILRAQTIPPPWGWAKADTAGRTSGAPAHALAATNGKVLWGEMQKKKMISGPDVFGDHGLMEYDSACNFLDSTTITGKFDLLDAKADNAGNWYVLGKFFDTVNFPTGVQFVRDPYTFPALSEYFIFRLNSGTLSMAWVQHIGTSSYNSASAMTIANNNLYMVVDSVTTYICKVNLTTGSRTVLWPQTGLSRVSSIAADNSGNIYVAGSCSHDTISFNGHVENVPFFYNTYIVRYKASGAFDWVHWMSDQTCVPRTISLVTNNFIYYSGQLFDSLFIGSIKLHKPASFGNGFMAARLDSSGNVLWARQEPDTVVGFSIIDNGYSASITRDSCLQLFMRVRGAVNFGNGFISPMPSSRTNATILCINPDSTTKWAKYVRGLSTTTAHIVSNGRDVYVTGNGNDSTALSFDSIATPVRIGANTPYIAKINALPATPDTPISVPVVYTYVFTISPNPATNMVYISGLETIKSDMSFVSITDMYGKMIYYKYYSKPNNREEIYVGTYPRGLYFIKIEAGSYNQVSKLILK